jgi:hypothetical protein
MESGSETPSQSTLDQQQNDPQALKPTLNLIHIKRKYIDIEQEEGEEKNKNKDGGNVPQDQNNNKQKRSKGDSQGVALVGGVGFDYVSRVLSTTAPQEAVRQIQQKTGVFDERYSPVFGLLQHMGKQKSEVNKNLLSSIIQVLLRNIKHLSQEENLLDLLEASFIYIRIPELRSVPIAVLERLKSIPNNFLKQLSADRSVFDTLPQSVQRQVWELDKSLLQQHVSPLIHHYLMERATVLSCLNMNEENPNKKFLHQAMSVPSVHRQTYRNNSASLKKITSMIAQSGKIYKYVVNLCLTLYRGYEKGSFVSKDEQAYCTFRSQLLMALHDKVNELRTSDPCLRLAWALDAAVKERKCGEKRLLELHHIFQPYDSKTNHRAKKKTRFSRKFDNEDTVTAGGSTTQPDENTLLGEMGMVLRDPPVYFFLAREALKRLESVAEMQIMPKQDSNLIFLSRLLQIATECRGMLREKSFKFNKADVSIIREFYPRLACSLVDRRLVKHGKTVDPKAMDPYGVRQWLRDHPVAQVVYQMFVIDCLSKNDFDIAQQALMTIASVFLEISNKALVEWGPFMYSLAERLQSQVQSRAVKTTSNLWKLAVDQILIKAIHSDVEVHKHVLQLVEVAAPQLGGEEIARYLETMLDLSEKSRKRYKKKLAKILLLSEEQQGGSTKQSKQLLQQEQLQQTVGDQPGEASVHDGVHPSYCKLVDKLKNKINEESAPKLFEYTNNRSRQEAAVAPPAPAAPPAAS